MKHKFDHLFISDQFDKCGEIEISMDGSEMDDGLKYMYITVDELLKIRDHINKVVRAYRKTEKKEPQNDLQG